MLLSSVILVLQETLEAAFLIGVLTALGHLQHRPARWLLVGIGAGLVFASVYAHNIQPVSEWFDYVGQELVNAGLQIMIALLLTLYLWRALDVSPTGEAGSGNSSPRHDWLISTTAALTVLLAITREGSEVLIYLWGVIHQSDSYQAVLIGSSIGFGIGLSMGCLLFYALVSLPFRWAMRLAIVLLALFTGNMLAQAVLLLIQADWIPSTQPLWDSSGWLPEHALMGRLLYALVGYEATPSAWEVTAYLVGFTGIMCVAWRRWASLRPTLIHVAN